MTDARDPCQKAYPDGLAKKHAATSRADQEREMRRRRWTTKPPRPIPPHLRMIMPGHSPRCTSCTGWTRHPGGLGGCPGVVARAPKIRPGCHSDFPNVAEILGGEFNPQSQEAVA